MVLTFQHHSYLQTYPIYLSVCLSAHPSLRLLVSLFTTRRMSELLADPIQIIKLKLIPVKLRTKGAHGIDALGQCSTS